MQTIPSSVPVFIEDIEPETNNRYSVAKLKVFYIGETPDHRLFTKEFAEKVVETLPNTPVVGFWSEEKEDFVGHNDVQYIYGVVPETAEMSFEKDEESGNTFLITTVYLYTERDDNIGEVARHIVGKQHSLELNSKTVKYKINRYSDGKFRNIQFTDGDFIGLSVLGDDEKPAFTGSGFFTINENFKEMSDKCHQSFDNFLEFLNTNGGQIEVFNCEDFFQKTGEFVARTVQEEDTAIYVALDRMGVWGYIAERTNEYAVINTWTDDGPQSTKYDLVWSDNGVELSNPRNVRARYLTDEELDLVQQLDTTASDVADAALDSNKEEEQKEEVADDDKDPKKEEDMKQMPPAVDDEDDDDDKKDEEVDDKDDVDNDVDDDDKKDPDFVAQEQSIGAEGVTVDAETAAEMSTIETTQEETIGESLDETTASFSVATLFDSERRELENFRREQKIRAIENYTNDLPAETLNSFKSDVDNFTLDELEAKLALEFRKHSLANPSQTVEVVQQPEVTTFSFITTAESYDENNPADVIKKYRK